MMEKNLKYNQEPPSVQRGLGKSREKKWKKWMDFSAGVKIEGEILDDLIKDGMPLWPTQWIETDQNEHLKRPGQPHTPDFKSRLVACGQFEDRVSLRTARRLASY